MPNTLSAQSAGSQVQNNSVYQGLVTVGLVAYGIIHLLMAWICVQLVTGGGGQEASNQGALRELASQPLGGVLLWVIAVGMVALAVWQAIEAAIGHTQFDDKKRMRKRISSVGRAVLYLALALTAGRIAMGGQAQNSNQAPQDASGTLMGMPGGPLLVGLLAAAVVAIGVSQVVKGVKRKFVEEDLDGGVPEWAKKLGTVGWVAKGVSLGLAGLLIAWAAVTFDPKKAAGLDGALKTLAAAPFGGVLLVAMALGFLAFAGYCFVWSRNARHARG
ncbi:DUF1206 domain-containing protein [Mariniluteicoccus endophyticus]